MMSGLGLMEGDVERSEAAFMGHWGVVPTSPPIAQRGMPAAAEMVTNSGRSSNISNTRVFVQIATGALARISPFAALDAPLRARPPHTRAPHARCPRPPGDPRR